MLCPGCFNDKGEGAVCPRCGWDEATQATEFALAPRTLLQGRYVVGRVLGKPGGFGITYLARQEASGSFVAVKEFLPRSFAGRAADNVTVAPYRGSEEEFAYGLTQFQDEYRNLERFDHLNVVRTRDFFQENGTAYLVMDFYEGLTLEEFQRGQGGRIPAKQAADILLPVLDGLRAVHGQGFLHRDVKPANIYLAKGRDGLGARPILLDFGGAKAALGQRTQSMSELWTGGFSPFEQYQRRGRFGPWSDVYSCGATLYALVTGQAPPDAPDRIMDDALDPPSTLVKGLPPAFEAAVLHALAVRPQDRFQSMEELTRALLPVSSSRAWDVFLCKNSKDLQHARQVHDYLAARGVEVFLSELAVPDSSRTEYGAVIDQAVEACAHMVVVASKAEHLESPYVQAELRMFLEEHRSGRKRGNLISVLAGSMAVAELPISLRSHQAVRLDTAGLAELGRFVDAREEAAAPEIAFATEPASEPEAAAEAIPAPNPWELQATDAPERRLRPGLVWEAFFVLAGLAILVHGLLVPDGLGALDLGTLFRFALGARLLAAGIRARKRPGLSGGILFGLAMLGASLVWVINLFIVRDPGDLQTWESEYVTLSVSAQSNLFMALGLAFFGLSLGRRRTVLLHVLGAALLGLSLLALPLSWTLMQRPGEGLVLENIVSAQQTMIIYFALASACLACLGCAGFLAAIRVLGRRFSLLFGGGLVLFMAYLAWFPHYLDWQAVWHCFLLPSLYMAVLAVRGARTDAQASASPLGGWLRAVVLAGGFAVLLFLFLSVFRLSGEMYDVGSNESSAPAETGGQRIGDAWTGSLSGMECMWVPGGSRDKECGDAKPPV